VLVRNVLSSVAGRGVSIAAWLAITPYILGRLGPERFGLWSLLSTFMATVLMLDLGLGSAVTKYVAEHADPRDVAAQRGAYATGALVAGGLAMCWGAAGWLGRDALLGFAHVGAAWHHEASRAAGVMVLTAVLGLLALVPGAALTGLHRMDLVNGVAVIAALVQTAASVLLLARGAGLPGLALAMLLGSVTSLLASLALLRRLGPQLTLDLRAASRASVVRQLRFSAALQVIALGVLIQFQLPKFVFARLAQLATVGEYELAYRVAFAAWSLPSLVLAPLLPALSELTARGDWRQAWALYRRAGRYLLALALPIAALLASLGPALIASWLGSGHERAGIALTTIAAVLGVNVLTSAGSLFGRGIGRPWMEARYLLLSFVLQASLAATLVPLLGWTGGLWAMALSGILGTAQFLWVFHRALRQSLRDFFAGIVAAPALASLAGALVAWAVCGVVQAHTAGPERTRAALGVVAGGAGGAAVVALGLARARYISRAELGELTDRLKRVLRPS
jgi:O-antigen/teichoic acid export membrane protein